jgi:hypothetical protein
VEKGTEIRQGERQGQGDPGSMHAVIMSPPSSPSPPLSLRVLPPLPAAMVIKIGVRQGQTGHCQE